MKYSTCVDCNGSRQTLRVYSIQNDQQMKKTKMSKYNANVRIGNWYDDLALQEEKAKLFMRKTKTEGLKVQKSRKLFLSLLKEVPLTFPVAGLSYGAVILIVAPEAPSESVFGLKEKQGMALAADIDFTNVDYRATFTENDPIIGTGLLTPCVRNVWTLVPTDKSKEGKEMRFGDTFYIKHYSSDPPLYIEAPTMSPGVPKGESGHVVPHLINYISTLSRFKVVDFSPAKRFETEGTVVPSFQKVAIIHACNSSSLAIEPDTWMPTFFGMECEVSIHTYKDNRDPNKPDYRNAWSFFLGNA